MSEICCCFAIGIGTQALATGAVALGDGVVARNSGEVRIGAQLYCTDLHLHYWWNSPECRELMYIHKQIHSPEDYAKMLNWLEHYFASTLSQ
jgi:hypothetical protein